MNAYDKIVIENKKKTENTIRTT